MIQDTVVPLLRGKFDNMLKAFFQRHCSRIREGAAGESGCK